MGAQIRAVACREGVVLEAMAVLKQQESALVDFARRDRGGLGCLASRVGDEQGIIKQRGAVDLAAGKGKSEEHAIELAPMQRLAGAVAGFFAQVELELRPLL